MKYISVGTFDDKYGIFKKNKNNALLAILYE